MVSNLLGVEFDLLDEVEVSKELLEAVMHVSLIEPVGVI
jgi:hypothetical protein